LISFFRDGISIDILGFSFCYSEIDLWWILAQREKLIQEGKLRNKIRYFDLKDSGDKDGTLKIKEKLEILEAFEVEVVKIESTQNYDSTFYNSCLEILEKSYKKTFK